MKLEDYFSLHDGIVSFTEQQASNFAKGIAGDFNPLHDPGNRRFCVPGDLLFCILLRQYGVAQHTTVQFAGMLDGKTQMHLPATASNAMTVRDSRERELLTLLREGDVCTNAVFVSALSQAYVTFSGHTFPDILVPLMRDAAVMINPGRPMVIYKDMSIELNEAVDNLSGSELTLNLGDTDISVNGRKALVRLTFAILENGNPIGKGEKNMVLSGLREFDEAAMHTVVEQYNQWRSVYQAVADEV